jgi:hypothetical protein
LLLFAEVVVFDVLADIVCRDRKNGRILALLQKVNEGPVTRLLTKNDSNLAGYILQLLIIPLIELLGVLLPEELRVMHRCP